MRLPGNNAEYHTASIFVLGKVRFLAIPPRRVLLNWGMNNQATAFTLETAGPQSTAIGKHIWSASYVPQVIDRT